VRDVQADRSGAPINIPASCRKVTIVTPESDLLAFREPNLERGYYILGYLVLELQNDIERAVELFRPKMSATPRFDELRVDAHAIAGRLNAPFNYIVGTEFLSDLGSANRLALVGKCRGSGDDEQVVDLGELGCQIFQRARHGKEAAIPPLRWTKKFFYINVLWAGGGCSHQRTILHGPGFP
jgi:hypothetical protein